MRVELAEHLRVPRRWTGRLRRTALARAIRGSNSIEGYHVELDDADAALDDEEPLSADQRTFAEIRGYRQALGYVLAMATDEHFRLDASALRSMHFMMLSHDLSKSPGRYRERDIYVHDERSEQIVYTGPDAEMVADLIDELILDLAGHSQEEPTVQGAMAHLNVVMIEGGERPGRAARHVARGEQEVVATEAERGDPGREGVDEILRDPQRSRLVVLRVRLGQHVFAGGGVLAGDLDDGLLDGQRAPEDVDVPGPQRHELTPTQNGLDVGEHHRLDVVGHRGQEAVELGGREGCGTSS